MKAVVLKAIFTIVGLAFLFSCTKNIEPLPDAVKLNTSFSLPVGTGEVTLSKTLETLGIPSVNLTENVPPWATYGVVYYADTLPLNLTEVYDNAEYIKYFMIRTNVWNDFPLGGFAQIYFLNGDDAVIDSLYSTRVTVPAAEHYDNGVVVGTKFESFRTEFNKDRIDLLSDAQKMVVYSGLIVTNEGVTESNINYFDQYKLKVQVAVRVDFTFNAD